MNSSLIWGTWSVNFMKHLLKTLYMAEKKIKEILKAATNDEGGTFTRKACKDNPLLF